MFLLRQYTLKFRANKKREKNNKKKTGAEILEIFFITYTLTKEEKKTITIRKKSHKKYNVENFSEKSVNKMFGKSFKNCRIVMT